MTTEPITEHRNSSHADIDLLSTVELVELINDEDARVAPAVGAASASLAAAIDAVVQRLQSGGRLIYVGAGSSGRLAVIDAAECGPTFGVGDGRVVAVIAGGAAARQRLRRRPRTTSCAGAADLRKVGVGPNDAVVALSASGSTPFVLGAMREAVTAGAATVGVVCAEHTELGRLVDHTVVTVVGPEVIAGSTRMKAGTAQKLVLNTISTVSMVRLGRTYGNLMVDVVASNSKLRARARRAVELATAVTDEEIDTALVAADGDTKVAIVSLLAGVDAQTARRRLDAAGGAIRAALEARTDETRGRGRGRRRAAAARRRRDRRRPDRGGRGKRLARPRHRDSRASSICRSTASAASTSPPPTSRTTGVPAKPCSSAASRRSSRP